LIKKREIKQNFALKCHAAKSFLLRAVGIKEGDAAQIQQKDYLPSQLNTARRH
jgi:hypothetical protein